MSESNDVVERVIFDALHSNDFETFKSQLLKSGWPETPWSDHSLISKAITLGRKEFANFLLDQKCRVTKSGELSTLVHRAAKYPNWTDIVVKLISLGSPVSTVDVAGDTAVHAAFTYNPDEELIDLLLAAYVQECFVNIKNKDGLSVLHIACSRFDVEIVRMLTYRDNHEIVTHDDVNGKVKSTYSKGYHFYTPLHFAARSGCTEIVKFLLQHFKIDIHKKEAKSLTALQLARDNNHKEICDCLIAHDKTKMHVGIDKNRIAMSRPTTLSTKLLTAMRENDLNAFCSIFNHDSLPAGHDYDLLKEAVLTQRKEFVHWLLDSSCETSKPDSDNTLVHLALANDWQDVVEKLLELEAPVSTRNSKGDTAVHVAFDKGYSGEVIDCLLGCYLLETTENIKNADRLSVLHLACSRPDVECFKKIVFKSENEKSTVYQIPYDDLNCVVHLESKSRYAGYTPLHFAAENGCTEIVNLLVHNCHVNICKQDLNGSTPVHLALRQGDIEAIDIILANNTVYQDYVNKDGLTHVMAACAGSVTEIATNFLNYINMHAPEKLKSVVNAKVEDPNNPFAGYTPLHFAAEYGRFATVQMLYLFEAYIFAKTAQGFTALVIAIKHNQQFVARLIFNYYKAYRQSICGDTKDAVFVDEIPSMQELEMFQ